MIEEVIYTIGKAYFMLAALFYVYALMTNNLELFAHLTGIIAILFLISNIRWYTKG